MGWIPSTGGSGTAVAEYAACATIVRAEAKNFSYGIRLLPPEKRRGMCAVYALSRRIDDIVDGPSDSETKLRDLDGVADALRAVEANPLTFVSSDPVFVAVADLHRRVGLPLDAFHQLIEGCCWDVLQREYRTIEELVEYASLVAGSVGRLSLAVFGGPHTPTAVARADALGVALQLTNILRDIVEDRNEFDRTYLPSADIVRFGWDGSIEECSDEFASLVLHEASVARTYFDEGFQLLAMLDRRSRACTGTMAGIYFELLELIERDPCAVLRGRVSVPTIRKVAIAGGALVR
jgi:phytoene synthase